jgi:hypothetical protein
VPRVAVDVEVDYLDRVLRFRPRVRRFSHHRETAGACAGEAFGQSNVLPVKR